MKGEFDALIRRSAHVDKRGLFSDGESAELMCFT